MNVNALIIFSKVADLGGFTAAARQLKLPKSLVSQRVSKLEEDLQLRLLNRSTRKVSLTAEGRKVLEMVTTIEEQVQAITNFAEHLNIKPSGVLKVTAPHDLGIYVIRTMLPRFITAYPDVKVEIDLSNRFVDLVDEGFDLALRAATAPLPDSSLVATRICDTALRLYTSPEFYRSTDFPRSINSLGSLPVVTFNGPGGRKPATLHLINGSKAEDVPVNSPVRTNDMLACKQAVLAGLGVGLLPELLVLNDVEEGRLMPVFEGWFSAPATFFAVRPGRRHVPAKTKCFIDHLISSFSQG